MPPRWPGLVYVTCRDISENSEPRRYARGAKPSDISGFQELSTSRFQGVGELRGCGVKRVRRRRCSSASSLGCRRETGGSVSDIRSIGDHPSRHAGSLKTLVPPQGVANRLALDRQSAHCRGGLNWMCPVDELALMPRPATHARHLRISLFAQGVARSNFWKTTCRASFVMSA